MNYSRKQVQDIADAVLGRTIVDVLTKPTSEINRKFDLHDLILVLDDGTEIDIDGHDPDYLTVRPAS